MSKNKRPNPVAKYGRMFNHGEYHRDKTKYTRKRKYRGIELDE